MNQIFNAEKDVETFLRNILEKETGTNFITAKGKGWQTDGIIEWQGPTGKVSLLLEAKFNKDLTDVKNRSVLLAQVLYYYNRLQETGKSLPELVLAGDEKYSFLIPFNLIESYLNLKVDWSRPPSNPDPSLKVNLDVFLYETTKLKGPELKKHCEDIAKNSIRKIKPSKQNLSNMYQYWVDHIFPKDKYSSVERAHVFYNCICYSETDDHCAYLHPTKKNILVVDSKEYELLISVMKGFFGKVQRGLSAIEIDELISMRDRIIEEDTRRRQGAFYTPSLWVDEAHKELDAALGKDWKDECIVWDCCAGTGNLTRNYEFSNLILSTAELTDIQAIQRECYNEGAEIFQYDFLNPETESPFFTKGDNLLPLSTRKKLQEAAKEGKRLLFLINPPYATAAVAGAKGEAKAGVAKTLINQKMKNAQLGSCSQQLYAQFLFQCEQIALEYNFIKKTIAFFSPLSFITSSSFMKFRSYWKNNYSYNSGFMFQASNFANVSNSWPVIFTVWSEGVTERNQELPVFLKTLRNEEIVSFSQKNLYSGDNNPASSWVIEFTKKLKTFDAPQMKTGLKISQNGRGRITKGSLLYLMIKGNNVVESPTGVSFTHCGSNGNGLSVLPGETWRRAIALFSARKLIKSTWLNQKDEYLTPRIDLEGYEQWVDDCHIYALLHTSNNASSMRAIEYKGESYNLYNHFFWLTRQQALELYGNNRETRALYRDAKKNPIVCILETKTDTAQTPTWYKNGDPYFSHLISDLNLSPLALEIFQDLNKIFVESLPLRKQMTHVTEKTGSLKLHLNSWDAGVYQLKKLWYSDPILKAKWELLRLKHLRLAKQLQPGVYKYGFLK